MKMSLCAYSCTQYARKTQCILLTYENDSLCLQLHTVGSFAHPSTTSTWLDPAWGYIPLFETVKTFDVVEHPVPAIKTISFAYEVQAFV
jgi:hypothetical protein